MKTWLLDESVRIRIDAAAESNIVLSAEQMDRLEAIEAKSAPTWKGSQAIIPIEGVLTQKRDFLAAMFGGGNTLYPDIIKAIDAAEQ